MCNISNHKSWALICHLRYVSWSTLNKLKSAWCSKNANLIFFFGVAVSAGAFCGNKIVEAGEECDCGYDDAECTDKCCHPRQSESDKKNKTGNGCKRKPFAKCR